MPGNLLIWLYLITDYSLFISAYGYIRAVPHKYGVERGNGKSQLWTLFKSFGGCIVPPTWFDPSPSG